MSINFQGLDQETLIQKLLEQESELEQLRPKPALFKVGQVVHVREQFSIGANQPRYFRILSAEYENARWKYGWRQRPNVQQAIGENPRALFDCFGEQMLASLTQSEFDGSPAVPMNEPNPLFIAGLAANIAVADAFRRHAEDPLEVFEEALQAGQVGLDEPQQIRLRAPRAGRLGGIR